jgi:hypothetical protein
MTRLFPVLALFLATCTAIAAPVPEEKPFETGWDKPVDPDGDCQFKRERGALTIVVPGKDDKLAVVRRLHNPPRLLRDVEGDFVAQVRVSGVFHPTASWTNTERVPFVSAGLVLMDGESTYVRLERAALVKGEVLKTYANWELRRDGEWLLMGAERIRPLEDKETFLRLERKGDEVLGSVSQDGKTWHSLMPIDLTLPKKVKLGVAAGTTSTDTFSPRYDGFKLTQAGGDLRSK